MLRSCQLHANAYITELVDFRGFIEAIKQLDHFFVSVVHLPTREMSRLSSFSVCPGPRTHPARRPREMLATPHV